MPGPLLLNISVCDSPALNQRRLSGCL